MKKIFIALIISIFISILFLYLANSLSPWNREVLNSYIDKYSITSGFEFNEFVSNSISSGIIFDYLDLKNILIIALFITVAFTSILSTIHLIIDKLFFKKFYEQPNHTLAIRRSFWIPFGLILYNLLRLFGGINILGVLIVVSFIIVVIVIEVNDYKGRRRESKKLGDKREE